LKAFEGMSQKPRIGTLLANSKLRRRGSGTVTVKTLRRIRALSKVKRVNTDVTGGANRALPTVTFSLTVT